jgi:hypothetical protein
MNIGKFSINDIVKLTFDSVKVRLATTGLFAAMLVSILCGYLANFLLAKNAGLNIIKTIDIGSSIVAGLIVFYTLLGIAYLIKQGTTKTKGKSVNVFLKSIFWKALGVVILFILAVLAVLLAVAAVSQLIRIPVVGIYILALLSIPAFIVFAYLTIFLAITSKILIVAIVDQANKSVLEITSSLIALTKKNPKKLLFNGIAGIFAILPLALAIILLFIATYFMYIFFGWHLCGMSPLLGLYLQSGIGFIHLILSVSACFVIAYLAAHLITMAIVISYSIYLDAQ